MSRNKILVYALVILVIAGAVYLLFKGEEEALSVQSKDGALELSIVPSALPKGVTQESISISKLDLEEFSKEDWPFTPLEVYSLEPDGMEFKKPINLSIQTSKTPGGHYPTLFHISSSGSIEQVTDLLTLEQEDGSFVLSGSVQHFSRVVVAEGFFSLEMTDETITRFVGESFVLPAAIHSREKFTSKEKYPKRHELLEILSVAGDFYIPSSWGDTGNFSVVPSRIPDRPPEGTTFSGETFETSGEFTCAEVGTSSIRYDASVVYNKSVKYANQDRKIDIGDTEFYEHMTKFVGVACIQPEAEVKAAVSEVVLRAACGGAILVKGEWREPDTLGIVSVELDLDGTRSSLDHHLYGFQSTVEVPPGAYTAKILVLTEDGREIEVARQNLEVQECGGEQPDLLTIMLEDDDFRDPDVGPQGDEYYEDSYWEDDDSSAEDDTPPASPQNDRQDSTARGADDGVNDSPGDEFTGAAPDFGSHCAELKRGWLVHSSPSGGIGYCSAFTTKVIKIGGMLSTPGLSISHERKPAEADAYISQEDNFGTTLGQSYRKDGVFYEFRTINFGDYATFSQRIRQEFIWEDDELTDEKKQMADLSFRIRTGHCLIFFDTVMEEDGVSSSFAARAYEEMSKEASKILSIVQNIPGCE